VPAPAAQYGENYEEKRAEVAQGDKVCGGGPRRLCAKRELRSAYAPRYAKPALAPTIRTRMSGTPQYAVGRDNISLVSPSNGIPVSANRRTAPNIAINRVIFSEVKPIASSFRNPSPGECVNRKSKPRRTAAYVSQTAFSPRP